MFDGKQTLAAIRANHAKLDACPKHRFKTPPPPYEFGLRLKCENCGGELNAVNAMFYTLGYQAAGGNPNEIIEDFN